MVVLALLLFVTCTVREDSRECLHNLHKMQASLTHPLQKGLVILHTPTCVQDEILSWPIRFSVCYNEVSLKFRVIASVCSKNITGMCCNFTLIHSKQRKNEPYKQNNVNSCTAYFSHCTSPR